RRRHTRSIRDWSSDVCSSDLTFIAGDRILQRICRRGGDTEVAVASGGSRQGPGDDTDQTDDGTGGVQVQWAFPFRLIAQPCDLWSFRVLCPEVAHQEECEDRDANGKPPRGHPERFWNGGEAGIPTFHPAVESGQRTVFHCGRR